MNEQVKRYDYGYKDDGCGGARFLGLIEKPYGALVRHSDYAALEAECERLRAQVSALQSDANSWQSGYDKGREDGAKAADGWKAQHARDSAELRRLCAERDALHAEADAWKSTAWERLKRVQILHAEAEALRAALLGIASVNPAERGIEWAKSYASDGLKGAGSELYARWLETSKEAEALRAERDELREELSGVKNVSTETAKAMKRLVMCARTSGGTAGPDAGLMDACEQAEKMLSLGGIGRAYMEGADATQARP